MYSGGSAQTMPGSELPGMTLDRLAQLDRPKGGPVLLEGSFCGGDVGRFEVVVAQRCAESSSHLGVGEPAGDRRVAAIPQFRCEIASVLFDEELYECARVEVHERHESATLFAHKICHRAPSSRSVVRRRQWSVPLHGAPDHSLAREALQLGDGVNAEQPDHWQSPFCDDDLFSVPGTVEPRAQVGSQFTDGDFQGLDRTS